jgi:hypothetical protein
VVAGPLEVVVTLGAIIEDTLLVEVVDVETTCADGRVVEGIEVCVVVVTVVAFIDPPPKIIAMTIPAPKKTSTRRKMAKGERGPDSFN